MTFTNRESMLGFVVIAALAATGCKGDRGPAGEPGPSGTSAVQDPTLDNLNLQLTDARVTPENKVQVDYTLTDPSGAGISSAADVTGSWTLAVLGRDADSSLDAWQSLIFRNVTGAKGATRQPTSESNGVVENLGGGKYRYTYATALPDGFDRSATYRAAVYARRPIRNTSGLQDVANGILDFVPGGGTPRQRDLVSTQACNTCHTTMRAHGGFRRETRLCATCHTTQLFDPDTNDTGDPTQLNPLDFGRMVHRIHRGKDLPTVENANAAGDRTWAYHVIGFGNADIQYGHVITNPNPAAGQPATITAGIAFPRDLRGCQVCHTPARDAAGNVLYGGQAEDWKNAVSRRTCQSCHDSSWFKDGSPPTYHVMHQQATNPTVAAGTNPATPAATTPAGLIQTDDSQCRTCHSDVLMAQHHTSPFASTAFNPLTIRIDGVTVTTPPTGAAAGSATVTFTITNKDGSPVTSLATLGSASINLTGPTTPDFSGSATDSNIVNRNIITAGNATPTASPGQFTSAVAIPAGATGTWAVGMEARRANATLTASERKLGRVGPTATFNEFANNPVSYFTVSGTGRAVARRQVVEFAKCNVCHETLSIHGGLRHEPQYCVMCHTPDNTDVARRPGADAAAKTAATLDRLPERSIHLKPMIHSIHTGEELQTQKPYVIYGFGGSANFFDEIRFPTSRANCGICHITSPTPTYTIDALEAASALPTRAFQIGPATPSAGGTLPVQQGGALSCGTSNPTETPGCIPLGPITATCMSCHDTPAAHAHAQANTQVPIGAPPTTPAVETCRVCHAENRELAVTRVHRQAASRDPE
jgi:OmcA/MtrC family decaheme c-type cytochrome